METTSLNTIKVAIVGPESSGKSTLALELAQHFDGNIIQEFARNYLEENGANYTIEDLDYFAESQLLSEDNRNVSRISFCDTNALSIRVWSLYKYGNCSHKINQLISDSHYDLHLLLKPDLPYEFDPLREDSPQKNRNDLFRLFEDELKTGQANYAIIEGLGNKRLNNAIEIIKTHFSF